MTTWWSRDIATLTSDPTRATVLDAVRELSRQAWPTPRVTVCQESLVPALAPHEPAEPSHGPFIYEDGRGHVNALIDGVWTRVQPVEFADLLAGRVPIIAELERPRDDGLTFMGIRFEPVFWPVSEHIDALKLYWPEDVVLAVDPAAQVWPWTIETPQVGDPHFPHAVSWSTFDDEVGYWPEGVGEFALASMSARFLEEMTELRSVPARPEFQWPSYPTGIDSRATVANAEDLVTTLIEFARAGQRQEFDFLANSSGVAEDRREELWTGTRSRLGLA